MGVPQNGPIPEPMPDSLEGRMTAMEHNFYEIQARLARTEDSQAIILSKYQMLSETLDKCFQVCTYFRSYDALLIRHSSATTTFQQRCYL